ncbi:hypothetical protein CapIbe_017977 [Capra ibex]
MHVSGRARRCRLGRRRWVLQSPGTSHPEERPPHPGPRCSLPRHCPSAPWAGVFRTSDHPAPTAPCAGNEAPSCQIDGC